MERQVTVIPAVGGRKTRRLSAHGKEKVRVAAYCRVSTDQEEQLNSFENQVDYYTKYIMNRPDYQLVDIYADEGISGTNTKKRDGFNRMIADCEAGKIDLIILNSRHSRNAGNLPYMGYPVPMLKHMRQILEFHLERYHLFLHPQSLFPKPVSFTMDRKKSRL